MKEWVILGIFIKVLLYPAYFSTDFDVHRNWLAITNHLPISEWYYDTVSEWTLDYPPFFAYFEWILSQLAPRVAVDDGCLDHVDIGAYGWPTIVYQRTTVLASELVLAWSLYKFTEVVKPQKNARVAAALLWFSPSWLILDHIHFQYNGAMFGLLILSIVAVYQQHYVKCGLYFSVLLCFKHIYLYVAPAYFAYLLRAYIFAGNRLCFVNGLKLATVVIGTFAVAFGPFYRHLPQILSRLFPFARGLTHAYWAPNFWSLYSFVDRILGMVRGNASSAATRGIVGQVEFANLPAIEPAVTFYLSLAVQLLAMARIILRKTVPSADEFVQCVTLCGFASFLFGWHVHEKAVMVILVPFALVSTMNRQSWTAFSPLLSTASISLFPLIYTSGEGLFKYVYTATYLVVCYCSIPEITPVDGRQSVIVQKLTLAYNLGFAAVLGVSTLIPRLVPRLEFAGLMLLSVYSSLGVIASFLQLLTIYFPCYSSRDKPFVYNCQ